MEVRVWLGVVKAEDMDVCSGLAVEVEDVDVLTDVDGQLSVKSTARVWLTLHRSRGGSGWQTSDLRKSPATQVRLDAIS